MARSKNQRGQAVVETAIVMPLNVFLILAIIQLGLINQARYLAKYAAYRAARVGAMNHADHTKMVAAAEAALMPVIAMPGISHPLGLDVIEPVDSASAITQKALNLRTIHKDILPGLNMPMVDVMICGPLEADLTNIKQSKLAYNGSANEVDFDDPRVNYDDGTQIADKQTGQQTGNKLKEFEANKLRVQVQFNYRMPIPFANWAISRMFLGVMTGEGVRLGDGKGEWKLLTTDLGRASAAKIYVAPIFESYAFRMQSNFFTGKHALPTSDECVSFAHPNPHGP